MLIFHVELTLNSSCKNDTMAELPTSNSLDLKLAQWFSTVWPQNLRSEWEIGYSLDTPSCFQLSAYMKQQGGIRKITGKGVSFINLLLLFLKFRFSKKATKFETISHMIWRLLCKCQINWEIVSNFCGLFRMSELYSAYFPTIQFHFLLHSDVVIANHWKFSKQ